MKKILTNDELEIGKEYWCKPKTTSFDPMVLRVGESSGIKYLGTNRIWASDNNNQALERYDIIGPIEYPNFKDYE